MLKSAIYYLNNQTKYFPAGSLIESLKEAHISLIQLTYTNNPISHLEMTLLEYHVVPSESVLITDCDAFAKEFSAVGGTCIGYVANLDSGLYLKHAHVITDSLANIDLAYMEEEYNRVHRLPTTILTTNRMIIRELMVNDINEMLNLYRNPHYVQYIPSPSSLEEERQKQEAYITNIYNYYRFGLWGVFLKKDGTLIGRCGLQCVDIGNDTEVELAYLIDEAYSGQGYGYEATSHIVEYGKEQLQLPHLIARIHKDNLASSRLANRLGFYRTEQVLPENQFIYRIDFTD